MKYFENFPTIEYPIKYNSGYDVPFKKALIEFAHTIDMNIRFTITNSIKTNHLSSYNYVWKDGDRPDILALNYYGDFYYDWLVLLSADIFDWIHELPLSNSVLIKYVEDKYNMTFEESLVEIHHYEDKDGFIIDLDSYILEPEPKRIVSIYDYENEQNELRRNIKLISKSYLSQLDTQFQEKLREIKLKRRAKIV